MKKKIILILIILLIVAIPLIIIIYPVNKSNKYHNNMINNIYNNTDIKDITYINKDNNYYIIKNKENIIVLDLNYDIVYQYDINNIKKSKLELTYTRNNLYYKEVKKKKDKLIYNYYDVNTLDLVYYLVVGGTYE